MSNYEPVPMDIDDLENFNQLFHVAIGGIEEHLTGDQPDTHYIISTLLSLSRQLDLIVYDVGKSARQTAHEAALMRLSSKGSDAKEEALA